MSRAQLSEASRVALGPPTAAAIDAAKGDLSEAARLLGITRSVLFARIAECTIPLRDWVDRRWPQRAGHQATPVLRVETEPGWRLYVLAAHDDIPDGEHVNRVPAVGKVRTRVVCQQCKEARTG